MSTRSRRKRRPKSRTPEASPEVEGEASEATAPEPVQTEAPDPALDHERPNPMGVPVILWAIAATGLALRLPLVLGSGLWLDEISLLNTANEPVAVILRTVHIAHLIPVKALVSTIGQSELLLRLPSLAAGVVSIVLIFFLGRRLFGDSVGLIAACLLTFSPYAINYSVDAVYYSHMTAWCLGGTILLVSAIERGSVIRLAASALCGLIAFSIHPFAGLYFVALAIVGLPAVLTSPAFFSSRFFQRRALQSPKMRLAIGVGLAVTLFVGGGVLAWRFIPPVEPLAKAFIDAVELGQAPERVEISASWFFEYFTRIGPAAFDDRKPSSFGDLWAAGFSIVFLGLFAAGVINAARRSSFSGALLIVPLVVSFAVLFNLGVDRFFHIRYFSYFAPIYLLGISLSLASVIAVIRRAFQDTSNQTVLLAALVGAGFMIGASFPQHRFVYAFLVKGGWHNWDGVMPSVKELARGGENFLYTTLPEVPIVPYYLAKYGLDQNSAERFRFTSDRVEFPLNELRDRCYREESLWYVSSWQTANSPPTNEWAEWALNEVGRGSSLLEVNNDLKMFHWDMGGRYVLAPRILNYRPVPNDFSQPTTFKQEFLFEQTMTYTLSLRLQPEAQIESLRIDGTDIEIPKNDSFGSATSQIVFQFQQGRCEIELNGEGLDVGLTSIEIAPMYPEGKISVPAAHTYDLYPGSHTHITTVDSPEHESVVKLLGSGYLRYDVGIQEEGIYLFAIEGRDVEGLGAMIEVRHNGRTQGVVVLGPESDGWEEKGFGIELDRGGHEFELYFLSRVNPPGMAAKEGRQVVFRSISLQPIEDMRHVEDDRFFTPMNDPIAYTVDQVDSRGFPVGWLFRSSDRQVPKVVYDDQLGQKVLRAEIQPGPGGLIVRGPKIDMSPRNFTYYSAQVRAEGLENHSINIRTYYYDADNNELDSLLVGDIGVTRTSDWVRIVDLRPRIREAAYCRPGFWVYPNGRQPSPDPGVVYMGGLQLDDY